MATPAMTDNSPAPGSIAWAEFHIQYEGVEYLVPAGNTSERWTWWRLIGGTGVVESGPEIPQDLTDDDVVLFGNKNGIAVRIQSATLIDGELIVDGSILAKAVSAEVMVANELFSREGYFGSISADKIQSGNLSAALALLGSLLVGNISIRPPKGVPGDLDYDPGGILIPQTGGGSILLTGDGTASVVDAILKTRDLTVDGGFALNGLLNYINGKLLLGSGTPDPSTKTAIGYAAFTKNRKMGGSASAGFALGLARTTSGHYATILPKDGNLAYKELKIFDPTTRAVLVTKNSDDEFLDMMAVTAVGNNFYVLGQRWNANAAESQLRIQVYNTAGVEQTSLSRWITDGPGGARITNPLYWGTAIAADPDGFYLWVARAQSNGRIRFFKYAAAQTTHTYFSEAGESPLTPTDTGCTYLTGAMYVGSADFGAARFVMAGAFGNVFTQKVYDKASGTLPLPQMPAENFLGTAVDGLIWDGTRFVTLDIENKEMWLSDLNTTTVDTTVYAQHAWGSSSGKRSKVSDIASRSIPKRTWPMLTVPAPPKTGSGVDTADRVYVYLDTDNVTKLLTTVTDGVTKTIIAAVMSGTGAAPNTGATEFIAADATGILQSLLGNISLKGDGSFKLGDLIGLASGALQLPFTSVSLPAGGTYTGTIYFLRLAQVVISWGYLDRASGFNNTSHDTTLRIPSGFRPPTGGGTVVGSARPAYGSTATYRYRFFDTGVIEVQQSAAIGVFQSFLEVWSIV